MIAFFSMLGSAHADDLLLEPSMGAFRAVTHWHTVAEVATVPERNVLHGKGTGHLLLNGSQTDTKIPFLLSKAEYGDVKVELEFLIPRGSNAGVYLMGRYEVQILDSFGRTKMSAGDLGGIYQRYDASRPQGRHCLLYTSPSPRDGATSRMPSSA